MKAIMYRAIKAIHFWKPAEYELVPDVCEFCKKPLTTENIRIFPDDGGGYAMFICDSKECFEKYILRIGNGGLELVEAKK